MEPRIQYAKTADGVSIAFWTLGEGRPSVEMPNLPYSHVQLEWRLPGARPFYERLAENRKLVRYDNRGSGLSDRDVTDYSLDAHIADLDAVVSRLGLERMVLTAPLRAGPVGIAYAVRYPERVSHLVLWCTAAGSSQFYSSPQAQAIRALRDHDWELYSKTISRVAFGSWEAEQAEQWAVFLRECVTPEAAWSLHRAMEAFDATDLLQQVSCPALVLHRGQAAFPSVDAARGLASRIPGARLILLEGESIAPWLGDAEAMVQAVDDFLGEGEEVARAQAGPLPEGMAVILFTDIFDSTALTERMGDAAFRAKARELDERLRSLIGEAGGTPVEGKVLGDGVMAVFTSARQAIQAAIGCNAAMAGTGLELHLGIHAGDVIREGNNVYGGAVNVAARIAAASAPGEILVSDTVRSLARTSVDVGFEDRGEQSLKGVADAERLFAVRGRD